jgi:hypothetical protein
MSVESVIEKLQPIARERKHRGVSTGKGMKMKLNS